MEPTPPERETVEQLAEEFVERYRHGERPPLSDYLEQYPQHASEIRKLFPALVVMEEVAPDSETGAGDAAGEVLPLPVRRLEQPEQLGDYRILREVGRGGMGIVYEAEQVSLGRHVAVKVLTQSALLDARQRQRFEREARAAARLHHTNIVPVFGVGEDSHVCYYVMQFIRGLGLNDVIVELQRLLKENGPLQSGPLVVQKPIARRDVSATAIAQSLVTGRFQPPEAEESGDFRDGQGNAGDNSAVGAESTAIEADTPSSSPTSPPSDSFSLSSSPSSSVMLAGQGKHFSGGQLPTYWHSIAHIGLQVAEALHHAHEMGVLHRDIKPSNLLLDMQGNVWVTDFGLAKMSDEDNLTRTGDVLGTLRYLAPEVFDGVTDIRSEVYSLGLTLYELLTLRPAFDEKDRHRLIQQLTTAEPASLDWLEPSIPRDLATIVQMAIDRDPDRRYQTAGELAEDLQRFLRDEPIQARRATSLERLARWARHHPGVSTLLGVIGLLLLAITIASSVAAVQFRQLADDREQARDKAERSAEEARQRGDAERWQRYRSDIAAAGAALQLENSGTARIALEAAPPEYRGWEWRYFRSQLDGASLVLPVPGGQVTALHVSPSGEQAAVHCNARPNEVYIYNLPAGRLQAVLRGHSAPISFLVYRPDGKQIATSDLEDHTIRLWDPATGRETALLKVESAPSKVEGTPYLKYSPDGSRIVSFALANQPGPFRCTIRLWDANSGKEIAILEEWHQGGRPDASFSPDGKRMAVTSQEYVHVHDARTGQQLAVLGPHESQVWQVLYSPDGKLLAASTNVDSCAIHLWDGATGKEVAVLRGHTNTVLHMGFSPKGLRLVSSGDYPDNTVWLWDTAAGKLLARLRGHKNRIMGLAFSPDGRRLVTGSHDQMARLWDGRTGQLLAVLGGHSRAVIYVVFSPDGRRVVTASDDATLRLWDGDTGNLISVLRGHRSGFRTPPFFTPDSSRLVSGSLDGTLRIWDLSLLERNGILRGHESFVYDVAFRPDGEQVASASWDGTARLWDATTGTQQGVLKHGHESDVVIVSSVAYSPDGRRLATMQPREQDLGIVLWDMASRQVVHTWSTSTGAWSGDVRADFNPAGTLLAAGCFEGPVRLWDAASGKEIAKLKGHKGSSFDVAFAPDGGLLASAGIDGTVRLWDVATHAPRAVLRGHTEGVWQVAFDADGKLLASGSQDGNIRFWDVRTGESLAVIPVGTAIYGLAFSPDGTRLAAGCGDNTIRLVDMATREIVAELHGHTDYVHAIAWSPDGTRLVSGSGDGTVRIWDSLPPADRNSPRVE